MNWLISAILLLLLALIFDFGLLAYAMYTLLGVLLVSRFLTRRWAESLAATSAVRMKEIAAELQQIEVEKVSPPCITPQVG